MLKLQETERQLNRLNVGLYIYTLTIKGKNENTRLGFETISNSTKGNYRIKFLDASGMDKTTHIYLLDFEQLIFKTETISRNYLSLTDTENFDSLKLTLVDPLTYNSYDIDDIIGIDRDTKADSYDNFKSTVNQNKQLKESMEMLAKLKSGNYSSGNLKPSLWSRINSLFK